MKTLKIGERHLTVEFRNGTGLDIEFTESRPVWTIDQGTGELNAMAFSGIVII